MTCTKLNCKERYMIAFVLNMTIVAMELLACYMSFVNHKFTMFRFYTEDSNVLALVVCAVYSWYLWRAVKTGRSIPGWIVKLKYIVTCCLFVTFIVVVVVLAPITGVEGYMLFMFAGSMLYHHTLCPVLAVISQVFFEMDSRITLTDNILALVPTVVYGIILMILNGMNIVDGPYPFLHVNNQPLFMIIGWIIILFGIAYLLAFAIRWVKNVNYKKIITKATVKRIK